MPEDAKASVRVNVGPAVLDVSQNAEPFLVYNYAPNQEALFKPFLHPVMGSNGWPITQNGEFPGTLRGHYWHHGLFIGHQRVSHRTDTGSRTTSFWEERTGEGGTIVHTGFRSAGSGPIGGFVEQLTWKSFDGMPVLNETRTLVIPSGPPDKRFFDIELRFQPIRDSVRFETSKYNLLACRVINALCPLTQKRDYTEKYGNLVDFRPLLREGVLTNSEGQTNQAVTGQRAKWCDFSGPLDNSATGGIALLDHPLNPRFPTPWHNWNNMTFMASFTYEEFYELPLGKELKLKYRVYVHSGDAKQADVEGMWNDFGHRA